MSTTIGALNFRVSATSAGVAEEMGRTAAAVDSVARSTQRANAAMAQAGSGGSTKFARGFQELSRGVEDFSAVAGTGGIAAGFRAAANNISQFASIIHPAAGAVAGLGVALGTTLIPKLFDTAKAAAATQRAVDSVKESFKAVREEIQNAQAMREFSRDVAGLMTSKDVGAKSNDVANQIKDVDAAIGDISRKRRDLEKQMISRPDKSWNWLIAGGTKSGLTDQEKAVNKERSEQIAKLSEDLLAQRKKRDILEQQAKLLADQGKVAAQNDDARERDRFNVDAVTRVHEQMKRNNDLLAKARDIQHQNLAILDEEGAKRQKILQQEQEKLAVIEKAPLAESERQKLRDQTIDATGKQLSALGLSRTNSLSFLTDKKALAQMELDRFRQARAVLPVQAALQRGSAAEISANLRNAAQGAQKPTPGEQAIINEIKRLNQAIAKITGKPVELVQGHF